MVTEKYDIVCCNSVQFRVSPKFWANISPPSSGSKINQGKNHQEASKRERTKQLNSACRLLLPVSCLTYFSNLKMEAIYYSETSGLPPAFMMVSCSAYSSTLKMEAIC
jgi:hypothetical protein